MSRGGRGWVLVALATAALLGACRRDPGGAAIGRPDVTGLVAAVLPGVVRVHGRGGMAQADGSGFFIRGEAGAALVVTNQHVVWGASDITIERDDGVTDEAALVGVDPATDLALLRPRSGAAPATLSFADDATLRVGSWLLALGSPDGVFNAVSVGVLSSRGLVPAAKLAAERLVDHLFIDAAVGAGSSGGPVIDLSGHVVGVCLAVLGGGGGGRGLGVALPGSLAARVAHDLERDGHSAHGFAGVALAEENGGGAAVRVAAVVPGGPADQAGIRAGDRVLSLDGRPAHDARELRHRLFTTAPGAVSRIDLARAGARVDTALRVQPLPAAGGW